MARSEKLDNLVANITGGGGSMLHPGVVPSFGGVSASAPAAPSPADSGSSSSHPEGWFHGKLPGFGACGGKRGSLTSIWQIWGGEGPGKVTGGGSGWNLRQHGETTIKEQEAWGSTSNYGRYLQAGR